MSSREVVVAVSFAALIVANLNKRKRELDVGGGLNCIKNGPGRD
jgi:hypothetical protein